MGTASFPASKTVAKILIQNFALPFLALIAGCSASNVSSGSSATSTTPSSPTSPTSSTSSSTSVTPPSQAAAAGFTNLLFDDEFTSLSVASTPNSSATKNWYPGIWWESPAPSQTLITDSSTGLDLNWNRSSWTTSRLCDTTVASESANALTGQSFRYGYFEARMKWDDVPGAWPAFWMVPLQGIDANGSVQTGEIDIFEGQGLQQTYNGALATWLNTRRTWQSTNDVSVSAATDYTQWHTYGLLWTAPANGKPGQVTWYFDGSAIGSSSTTTSANSVFDQQNYYLVFSSQEGVNWNPCNPLNDGSASTINLYVNWVHVWGS